MEYYTATKRNLLLIHLLLLHLLLTPTYCCYTLNESAEKHSEEKSHLLKLTYFIIPYIVNSRNDNIIKMGHQFHDCQGVGMDPGVDGKPVLVDSMSVYCL